MKCCTILLIFLASLAAMRGDIVVHRFEPPVSVGVPDPDGFSSTLDFAFGENTNVFLNWGIFSMDLEFFSPIQIYIVKFPPSRPGATNVYGLAADLQFGTVIGPNVITPFNFTNGTWYSGDVIYDAETNQPDRGDTLGYVASDEVVGDPPIVYGNVVGKEGIIGLKVFIDGQPHYAYIHFDFRYIYNWAPFTGFGGYIYGYAYETQPNVPILTERLNSSIPASEGLITDFKRINGYALSWNAISGASYRVQSSTNLLNWADVTGDILANQNSVNFTLPVPLAVQCFYRIRRVN
jgi:hypothetical protein